MSLLRLGATWQCGDARASNGPELDIVGIGTVVAFAGSACIAVACLGVQYLFCRDPLADGTWTEANPVDVVVLHAFRDGLRRLLRRRKPSGRDGAGDMDVPGLGVDHGGDSAFAQFMSALGDCQLAMGLAMLTYGYLSLPGGLSAYHWWLVVGLAWLSVITNLAVLASAKTTGHQPGAGRQVWRTDVVCLVVTVLVVSMIPTVRMRTFLAAQQDSGASLSSNSAATKLLETRALCFFFPGLDNDADESRTTFARGGAYLLALGLAVAVLFLLLRLCQRRAGPLQRWYAHCRGEMKVPLGGDRIDCLRCEQRYLLLVVRPFVAFWLVLRLYADLLSSVLAQIFCITALLAWVMARLVGIGVFDVVQSTNWTFGQVMALFFFAAPFKVFLDSLCDAPASELKAPSKLAPAHHSTMPIASPPREPPKVDKGKEREHIDPRRPEDSTTTDDAPFQTPQRLNRRVSFGATSVLQSPPILPPPPPALTMSIPTPGLRNRSATFVTAIESPVDSPAELQDDGSNGEEDEEGEEDDDMINVQMYKEHFQGPVLRFYFGTPWCRVALPIVCWASLVQITLMLGLPLSPAGWRARPSHASSSDEAHESGDGDVDAVAATAAWFLAYVPLLVLLFFLGAMAADERARTRRRARRAARLMGGAAVLLATVAAAGLDGSGTVHDLVGLDGGAVSRYAWALCWCALAVLAAAYALYGLVARPGRLAKGKGVGVSASSGSLREAQACEEGAASTPLPMSEAERPTPTTTTTTSIMGRQFSPRKPKIWHGPSSSRRLLLPRRNSSAATTSTRGSTATATPTPTPTTSFSNKYGTMSGAGAPAPSTRGGF